MINVLERVGLAVTPEAPVLSLLGFFAVLSVVCFAIALAARRIPGLRKIM